MCKLSPFFAPETYQFLLLFAAHNKNSQCKKPSLTTERKKLYYQAPTQLNEQTKPNLKKRLGELLESGEEVAVTDPALPFSLRLNIIFK
jgi:ubiquitin-activating enzyme E1 C